MRRRRPYVNHLPDQTLTLSTFASLLNKNRSFKAGWYTMNLVVALVRMASVLLVLISVRCDPNCP